MRGIILALSVAESYLNIEITPQFGLGRFRYFPGKSPLEKLPNELLIIIAEFVNVAHYEYMEKKRTYDLWRNRGSLAFATKRFKAPLNHIFWRDIILADLTQWFIFAKAVLIHPELGGYVRSLECCAIDEKYRQGFENTHIRECIKMIWSSPSDIGGFLANWDRAVNDGYWDAITAALLRKLSGLESLLLDHEYDAETPYISSLFEMAATQQFLEEPSMMCFSKLEHIHIKHRNVPDRDSRRVLEPYFKLKSVQSFWMTMRASVNFSPRRYQSSTMKTLVLHQSSLRRGDLVNLLQCHTSLKTFYFQCGYDGHEWSDLTPRHIGEAIAHLKSTLEVLILCIAGENFGHGRPWYISPLVEFQKLKGISSPTDFLFEPIPDVWAGQQLLIHCLPKCLEHLELWDCNLDTLEQVCRLLYRHEQLVPVLKKLHLHCLVPQEVSTSGAAVFSSAHHPLRTEVGRKLFFEARTAGVEVDIDIYPVTCRQYTDWRPSGFFSEAMQK